MKLKNLFLFLILLVIVVNGCQPSTTTSPKTSGPSADITDGNGMITFNVAGKDVEFKFVNENTGEPLSGLSVGFALGESKSQGLLIVIDPSERIQPQVVILRGGKSILTAKAIADTDSDSVGSPVIPIPTDRVSDIIQEIILEYMPQRVQDAVEQIDELMDITSLAAKTLNQAGIPLGKYAESLGNVERVTYTDEEAKARILNQIRENTGNMLFLFVATGEVPDARGVFIDTLSYVADYNAIVGCGPTRGANRIESINTAIGEFYGCKSLTIQEQTQGLVRVAAGGVDERGFPLTTGSLELLSKANIGFGKKAEIKSGKGEVNVPIGNYQAKVKSPGFSPVIKNVNVQKEGTTIDVTLEPYREDIISSGESSGLCSTNADCTGFAASNCDAPENVRCGKDGLCHCCLTLCPGGENCKCIGCSTGCGGGTYCEGDVCVFEAGGTINEEQTTETISTTPKEEPKDVPETWSGTLTGIHARNPDRPDAQCYKGEFSATFRVKFTVDGSLVETLQGGYFPSSPNGIFSGEETVSVQPISTLEWYKCSMSGGSLSDTAVDVIISLGNILIGVPFGSEEVNFPERTDGFDGTSSWVYQLKLDQITLKPESISDTTISGTWAASSSFKGTFTLTRQ